MSEQSNVRLKAWNDQAFCASYGDEAVWKEGLRGGVARYRDLGIEGDRWPVSCPSGAGYEGSV